VNSLNRLALVPDGSGGYLIRFDGIPNLTYRLERASGIAGPWDTIDTQIAPASGLIEYHETVSAAGRRLLPRGHTLAQRIVWIGEIGERVPTLIID